jgi:hypothetical protein
MPDTLNTIFEITVFARPAGEAAIDWRELDHGPGLIHLPPGEEIGVRTRGFNDEDLQKLVEELSGLPQLVMLNLSENRNITDAGVRFLPALHNLRTLNVSSVGMTNAGLATLPTLERLSSLDLSFCNRITDLGLKALRSMNRLTALNLQGCVKVTTAGIARLRRSGLTIHR